LRKAGASKASNAEIPSMIVIGVIVGTLAMLYMALYGVSP
jgi:hypothetical protein